MNAVIAARSKRIALSSLAKLSELSALKDRFGKEHKGKLIVITMTGTFPIAKARNVEGKKFVVEGGTELKDMPIIEFGSKWIEYINETKQRAYVKTEDAEKVTFQLLAIEDGDAEAPSEEVEALAEEIAA